MKFQKKSQKLKKALKKSLNKSPIDKAPKDGASLVYNHNRLQFKMMISDPII